MSRLREQAQNVVEYGLLKARIVMVVLLGIIRSGAVIEPWFASLDGLITTAGTSKRARLLSLDSFREAKLT